MAYYEIYVGGRRIAQSSKDENDKLCARTALRRTLAEFTDEQFEAVVECAKGPGLDIQVRKSSSY